MDDKTLNENLLDVLHNTRHITIATVCADGAPRCTPIGWWAFDDEKGRIVFDNRQGTIHADNLARDPRCFIAIVNYDQEHSRSVNIQTRVRKLTGAEYDAAKKLILDKGLKINDDIFTAPIGEIDKKKTRTDTRDDGSRRFYCYTVYKETK